MDLNDVLFRLARARESVDEWGTACGEGLLRRAAEDALSAGIARDVVDALAGFDRPVPYVVVG